MPTTNEINRLNPVDDIINARIISLSETNDQFWSSLNHDRRENVHSFFQYPAMMVPVVTKKLIDIIIESQVGIKSLLDPFVGAGTTLTAGMYHGLDCCGQDINPLAILVSRAKTGPFYYSSLVGRTQELLSVVNSDSSNEIEADFTKINKWFQHEVAIELSKLVRAIRNERFIWARRFYWVALAETVRLSSNDRTSTYKLHIRSADDIERRDISPISLFSNIVARNLEDLGKFKRELENIGWIQHGRYKKDVALNLKDTKEGITQSNGKKYDLLVTSPPYGDNNSTITYGQHSYLPLQWIDLNDIAPEAKQSFLKSTHEIDSRSLGGKRDRHLKKQVDFLKTKSVSLWNTLEILESKPRDRLSRVSAFYTDFIQTLDKIVNSLSLNAYLIWTVGNRHVGGIEIPNHQILTELLSTLDVHLVIDLERNIAQKRMPERNQISKTMQYEKILIFRKTTV